MTYVGEDQSSLRWIQAVCRLFPGGPQSDIQITISRPMSEFGRVTVTTKLGQLSQIMTDFQSKQLDYDRSGDRTRDLKHSSTLTIPLRHRSIKGEGEGVHSGGSIMVEPKALFFQTTCLGRLKPTWSISVYDSRHKNYLGSNRKIQSFEEHVQGYTSIQYK